MRSKIEVYSAETSIKNSSPVLGEVAESRRGYKNQCNNHPDRRDQRKELRKHSTPAEARLWLALKGKQLGGIRWRRQFSIGPYILDFYSPAAKLAVELDGAKHYTESGVEGDFLRMKYLYSRGVRVLRFENIEIWQNLEGVLDVIQKATEDPSACGTSPKTGEEF